MADDLLTKSLDTNHKWKDDLRLPPPNPFIAHDLIPRVNEAAVARELRPPAVPSAQSVTETRAVDDFDPTDESAHRVEAEGVVDQQSSNTSIVSDETARVVRSAPPVHITLSDTDPNPRDLWLSRDEAFQLPRAAVCLLVRSSATG